MTLPLALRVAAAKGVDLLLDQLLLEWAEAEGLFGDLDTGDALRCASFLKHCHGLTGNLTGAHDFVRMLLPSATLTLFCSRETTHATIDLGHGPAPRTAGSRNAANAVLAVALAAWALDRAPVAAPVEMGRRA